MTIISEIQKECLLNFEHAKPNLVFVGLLGFFGFPIYYFIWNNIFPQQYESLGLRVLCSFLFLPFIFYPRFSGRVKKLFPHYFFCALFITLPVFFSFMLIKNDFSDVWMMSFLASIFLLVVLVYNWILISFMILVGFAISSGVVFLLDGSVSFSNFGLKYMPIYFFAVVSGVICNYHTEINNRSKVKAMQALGGSVAHEMRNPLNAINMLLMEAKEVFEKSSDNKAKTIDLDKVNQIFATMLDCTKRANNIIDIILSNIRNEKTDNFTSEILSANELIKQAIKEYGYQNEEERKKIKLELGEDFVFKGEKSSFIYVLFNLIRNALYYIETYPNSVVTIKTIKTNQPSSYNKVIIRDTGPGISQDKIESLFKAFTTFDKSGGTGLGLNFVYNIMKALHGNVECNSKLGEFTEFILNFPVCDKNNQAIENLSVNIEVVDNDFSGQTILIIDDDMLHRMLVRRILENSFNLKVIEANNGEAALKILKNEKKIDLIFTDINMPVMDGYEFTKAIRSNSEFADYKDIQIIALTSNNDIETMNKIYNNGINESLIKGFGKDNLSDVLHKALRDK